MTSQRDSLPARAWVEVDLGAIRRNAVRIARRARVPILPMIKADGYGLGALPVARALEPIDPWGFGVATVPEGAELRRAGVRRRIIVFTPVGPGEFDAAAAAGLTLALGDGRAIAAWARAGGSYHLAIDTGMSRAGVPWHEVGSLADVLAAHPPEGAFTHFHSADRGDESRSRQEERFRSALAALPQRPAVVHCENGPAVEHLAPSAWSLARPGVFLYGVGSGGVLEPEPVASVRGRVVDLRRLADGETVSYAATYRAVGDRVIATVGLGYADGYRRAFGNRGSALVGGRRVPVAGVVTMDMMMLDVTEVPCAVGDVATLLGRDGLAEIPIGELARVGDLSPYELLTGLRGRLERVYVGEG
ncbi:MAG TPA: alanine racemase [Gemmatimonadaceae bacterium]|nr:alanine racemase [Gemmatimonadaceae bacterium]